MSTPAVNTNMVRNITGFTGFIHINTGEIFNRSDVPNVNIENKRESRPASVSVHKDSSGWRNPTEWYHSFFHQHVTPGTWYGWYPNPSDPDPTAQVFGDGAYWLGGQFGLPSFPSYLETSALNKALLGLKANSPNLAVAFAERKETSELAEDAINRVAALLKAFGRRHRMSLRNVGRTSLQSLYREKASRKKINDFLQVQYGVRPLMQDVHGATKRLNDVEQDRTPYYAHLTGTAKEETNDSRLHKSGTGWFGWQCDYSLGHYSRVELYYDIDNPLWASLSSLGITNPAELVWERIPFSFVVDWFIPVGNYLSSFDAAVGWNFRSGTITRFSKMSATSPNAIGIYYPANGFISNGAYEETAFNMQRFVLNQSPLPRIPRFKNPLSGQHVANAIALVVQLFH